MCSEMYDSTEPSEFKSGASDPNLRGVIVEINYITSTKRYCTAQIALKSTR